MRIFGRLKRIIFGSERERKLDKLLTEEESEEIRDIFGEEIERFLGETFGRSFENTFSKPEGEMGEDREETERVEEEYNPKTEPKVEPKTELKPRTRVIIKKNLGRKIGGEKDSYYYTQNLREIPLGTKGEVTKGGDNSYLVSTRGRGSYWFIGDELEIDIEAEEERKERFSSALEDSLLVGDAGLAGDGDNNHENSGTNGYKPFDPKLNVLEEFAVWFRDQFFREDCEREFVIPKERRTEVYKAAIKACFHGAGVTDGCIKGFYMSIANSLSPDEEENLNYNLLRLYQFIKESSSTV